jgi:signal transduction histidine kinase
VTRWDRGAARPLAAVALLLLVAGCALLDAWHGDGWFLDGPWPLLGALAGGYLAGSWLPAVPGALVVALGAAALTAANQRHDPGGYPVADDLVFFLLVVGAPAVAGATLTRRRGQIAELAALGRRIEQQRAADLEAARLEERQRIEVDVHRRLIERIGGLVLLAEGARHHPSAAAVWTALGEIEDAARAALGDLREAVGVLRTAPEAIEHTPAGCQETGPPGQLAPGVRDVALTAGVGGAIAVETVLRDFTRGPGWANVVAALLVAAPLVWRRTRPLTALAAIGLLAVVMTGVLTPLPRTVTALALLLVATYAAGAWSRRWQHGLALSWAITGALVLAVPEPSRDVGGLLPALVLTGLALLSGVLAAGAARREATLRSYVETLGHARDTERRAAVATTRLDLARRLHDSVAQAMTVTCLQAAAARGAAGDPDPALVTVLAAARECMAELRSGLDELDGQAAPGLDTRALRRLADHAGLAVEWRIDPAAEHAPVGALVQQVLREALTNAARHAPGSRVLVRVTDAGDRVEVEVTDDGSDGGRFALGTGTGLTGLREALAVRGGTLSAGPRAEGGFRVVASVPSRQQVPA